MSTTSLGLALGCAELGIPGQDGGGGALQSRIESLEAATPAYVDLLPGVREYSLVHADIGTFPIILDKVVPSPAGALVTLSIGNTTSATIIDLTATVFWGALDPDSIPQIDNTRSRSVKIAGRLRPGYWTAATFRLDGVPSAEVNFLRIADAEQKALELNQ